MGRSLKSSGGAYPICGKERSAVSSTLAVVLAQAAQYGFASHAGQTMRSDKLCSLFDRIYDAAVDPARWPDTLDFVSDYIGASFMSIVPYDDPSRIFMSKGGEHAMQSYIDHWCKYDTMVKIGIEKRHSRDLVCDWTELGLERLEKDSFYQEYRREVGIGHCLGATFQAYPGDFQAIGINLPLGRRPLVEDELEVVDEIVRHAARAMAITSRTQSSLTSECGLADLMERIPSCAAVVDMTARVSLANSSFINLEAAGLSISSGRICCARAKCQKRLEQLIRDALSMTEGTQDFALLDREGGGKPFLARVVPLSHQATEGIFGRMPAQRQALLIVVDLEAEIAAKSANALRLFGLTPAEARVAALLGSGLSTRQVAGRLGTTEGTVRAQLKQVFSKLEVGRQQDLMSIVSRIHQAV